MIVIRLSRLQSRDIDLDGEVAIYGRILHSLFHNCRSIIGIGRSGDDPSHSYYGGAL